MIHVGADLFLRDIYTGNDRGMEYLPVTVPVRCVLLVIIDNNKFNFPLSKKEMQ